MIRIRKGIVVKVISRDIKITIVDVMYDGRVERTVNYNYLTGKVMVNDVVYLNTSANYLNLGTGGYDYIIINETRGSNIDISDSGHIMKLRYTPFQIKCDCACEEKSSYYTQVNQFKDLGGMIIITGELHSMLAPTACTLKYINKNIKIAYIMTDGGSLPIDISFSVSELKKKNIIQGTITLGNAFGGDLEAVNIFDALILANKVLKCDTAMVTMGPGVVGTGTKYGFSGIEQGHIIDCINTLKGLPVFIPRVSFSDMRKRHYGLSHHSLTVLSEISHTSAYVILPLLDKHKTDYLKSQVKQYNIDSRHNVCYINCDTVFDAVEHYKVTAKTMGRSLYEDREFFLTCSSAARYATNILNNRLSKLDS